jgi:hypothetical protein
MEYAHTLYAIEKPLIVYPDSGSINRVHDRHLDKLSVLERIFGQPALLVAGMKVRKGGVLDTVNLQGAPDGSVTRAIAGTDALVVEDILDTGGTAENILRALKTAGARRAFLLCTHATSALNGVPKLVNTTFQRSSGQVEHLLDGIITSPSVRPSWSPFRTSLTTGQRERVVHELDIREYLSQIILRHWGGQLGALRELSSGPFPFTSEEIVRRERDQIGYVPDKTSD